MMKRFFLVAIVLVLTSCDKKFNDVGAEILPSNSFQGKRAFYPVGVTHALVDVVQTNNGTVLQLGERSDDLFGTTSAAIVSQLTLSSYSPMFGAYTAQQEVSDNFDEQEAVTNVWLEIPFFTNQKDSDNDGLIDIFDIDDTNPNSDSDGDGASDIVERNNGTNPRNPDTDGDGILDGEDTETKNPNPDGKFYDVDSLFGNREATFEIEINKLTYFLRQLDPDKNFEKNQAYFSDFQIDSYIDQQLGSEQTQLDLNEIILEEKDNLSPRLRVPLNKTVFKELIIDHEGEEELSTLEQWTNYFRAISIETQHFSAPLMMLLDINKMVVRVEYTYKLKEVDSTTGEEFKTKDFLLYGGPIKFNTLTQTTLPSAELNAIVASSSEQVAIGGGLGSVATISLFEDTQVLDELRANSWLLNEANLTFYVDKEAVERLNLNLPDRLYVYNANTLMPILDFEQDASSVASRNKIIYGGFLIEEDEKQYYKIRITDHLRNVIRKDSTNVPLRLALTDVFPASTSIIMSEVKESHVSKIPAGAVSTPKAGIFIGANPTEPSLADLKLQLELFYTEINQ